MKKVWSIILISALLFTTAITLTGCGSSTTQSPTQSPTSSGSNAEPIKIGMDVVSLTDAFIKMLSDGVVKYYKQDGIDVIVASADASPDKQIQQLENFAAMGVKQVIVMPLNTKGLEPVTKELRDKGISVVFVGDKPDYPVDGTITLDNTAIGKMISHMAIKWLNNTYPSAAAGSIHVAVLTDQSVGDNKKRGDAMIEIIKADPRVKVVFEKEAGTETTKALNATNEALAMDSSIKLVLCFNVAAGIAANTVIIGQKGVDPAKYAVFAGDFSPAGAELVDKSKTNESVLRGLAKHGEDDVGKQFHDISRKVLNKEVPLPYNYLDAMTPINSVGYTETK